MTRGLIHQLTVREQTSVVRNSEGFPTPQYTDTLTVGRVSLPAEHVSLADADSSTDSVDAQAILDVSVVLKRNMLIVVANTGIPLMDGTYRVTGFRSNRWHTVAMLRRYEFEDTS